MDVDHEALGLYKEVGKRLANLLIHGISSDFDGTAVDFSITEVDSNATLVAGSAELPLVAALMHSWLSRPRSKTMRNSLWSMALPPTSLINFHFSLKRLVPEV